MAPRSIDDSQNPPFTQVPPGYADENEAPTHGPPQNAQQPSAGWLQNPAWIDGGVNPPCYYYTHEEINDTLHANGISPRSHAEQHAAQMSRISPIPVPSVPAPLSFDFANLPQNNSIETATVAPAGHLINVTHLYSKLPPVQGPCTRPAAPKKGKITKLDNIILEGTTCVNFIKAFFRAHNINDQYSPGVHSGPDFKLWWSSSSGRKTGAHSIQNNTQFMIALQALHKQGKNKTHVSIEFNIDAMEGFWINFHLVLCRIEQVGKKN
ncbi:hypothetical protein K443DRAFT_3876 [Laccaria amethystina LaAM-08-1]|uniref:Uncharacterized protein n=1 Tax=Laccaria amethystina LaAM-08-1 TaxID=1095629 RepID=A0A0C9Y5G5_9AGAR|nr:hypothetical protein K443DRAFT_3876 [Laccaria amethystina LaAM-08-1]